MSGRVGYAEDGKIHIPDVRVREAKPEHRYVATRGYAASLAVFEGDRCVGWIDTRDLGFETAKAWLESGEKP